MKTTAKMRILFYCTFFLVLNLIYTGELKAQYILAGTHGVNDYYAEPDTVITANTYSFIPTEVFYNIDINGDGIYDFEIEAVWDEAPLWESGFLFITTLNGSQAARGTYNSCSNDTMALSLQRNDTIKGSSFKWYSGQLSLDSYGYSFYSSGGCSGQFNSGDTAFIGVRIFTALDTIYGWIRVTDVFPQGDGCAIIDFASGGPVKEIKDSTNNTQFKIYPNPSNGVFTILSPGISAQSEVEVYNLLGEKIYDTPITKDDLEIDLSGNPTGIYLYRIQTGASILVSKGKLVIQR